MSRHHTRTPAGWFLFREYRVHPRSPQHSRYISALPNDCPEKATYGVVNMPQAFFLADVRSSEASHWPTHFQITKFQLGFPPRSYARICSFLTAP